LKVLEDREYLLGKLKECEEKEEIIMDLERKVEFSLSMKLKERIENLEEMERVKGIMLKDEWRSRIKEIGCWINWIEKFERMK
jgi:hypothetical protein